MVTRQGDISTNGASAIETLRSAWAGRLAELAQGVSRINGVGPTLNVAIDSPVDGATIAGPDVTVLGSIINSTGAETGITVNGVPVAVSGTRFVANHVPLQPGVNLITATATDVHGLSTTVDRSIMATAGNYLRVTSNIDSGVAPLNISLRLNGSFSVSNPTLTASGPVPLTINPGANSAEFTTQLTAEGIYAITATATGPDGQTYSDTETITVLSKSNLDNLLKSKWEGMKTRLAARDIDGALTFIAEKSQKKYREMFTALGSQLPLLSNYLTSIGLVESYDEVAKVRTFREKEMASVIHMIEYVMYFQKENGIWKLHQF